MAIGYLQINGSGPANAAVGVYDAEENLIAETRSDSRGFWAISSVEMETGSHQLMAKMRAESGRVHISPTINATVNDPDADVEISAETLSPELVAEMEAIETERDERRIRSAAFQRYDDLIQAAVSGSEVSNGELAPVLAATGGHWDVFWSEVSAQRMREKYARLVLTVAAGQQLDERDQKSIWGDFNKTEEEFAYYVDRVRRIASQGWNTSPADSV